MNYTDHKHLQIFLITDIDFWEFILEEIFPGNVYRNIPKIHIFSGIYGKL